MTSFKCYSIASKIETWIETAIETNATHIILMYDKEDKDTYPVYVMKQEDVHKKIKKLSLSEGKQEVLEVVDIMNDRSYSSTTVCPLNSVG